MARTRKRKPQVVQHFGRQPGFTSNVRAHEFTEADLDIVVPLSAEVQHILGWTMNPPDDIQALVTARIKEAQRLKHGTNRPWR